MWLHLNYIYLHHKLRFQHLSKVYIWKLGFIVNNIMCHYETLANPKWSYGQKSVRKCQMVKIFENFQNDSVRQIKQN